MKTFFPSHEIPHLWANQAAPYGRSPSSLSFQGAILRSYSTDIGRILEPRRAVVLNLSNYSITTTRQQGAMRAAVRHYPLRFEVTGLDRGEDLRRMTPREIHDNLAKQATEQAAQGARCRSQARRDFFSAQAQKFAEQANRANDYFKLRRKPITLGELPKLGEALARRQKAEETKRQKVEAAKAAAYRAERLQHLEAWRAGTRGLGFISFREFPVALRLVQDDRGRLIVETSLGASVLLSQALRLFRLCLACRAKGLAWSADINPPHAAGPYPLRKIDAQGNAEVGCHVLPFAEMERLHNSLTPFQIAEASKAEAAEVVA